MFAFDKPISVEQAVRTLSAARNMILDGRLRYHRVGLEAPVTFTGAKTGDRQKKVAGQLTNLSLGGLQVRLADRTAETELTSATFDLPGTNSSMKADVEVAWSDGEGNVGIRFTRIAPQMHQTLRVWLAQQYFAN
jgi:c-di-GMP-binding flagellar brake protein YcgR